MPWAAYFQGGSVEGWVAKVQRLPELRRAVVAACLVGAQGFEVVGMIEGWEDHAS